MNRVLKLFITIFSVNNVITFVIKLHIDIALSYIYMVLNYMRIQALYALTGFHHIYILLIRLIIFNITKLIILEDPNLQIIIVSTRSTDTQSFLF